MNISAEHKELLYNKEIELYSIVCLVGAGCSIVAGCVLFVHYFCCSYSNILRSAFNDVFVAVVIIQVLQALQLLIFALITIIRGHHPVLIDSHNIYHHNKNNSNTTTAYYGMTYTMCNVNASLHQFLDAAMQVLQIAFFVVLANTRRLTSLEELEVSDDDTVIHTGGDRTRGTFLIEEEHVYSSSGRSSASAVTHPYTRVHNANPKHYYRRREEEEENNNNDNDNDEENDDGSCCFRVFVKPFQKRCKCVLCCCHRKRDHAGEFPSPLQGSLVLHREGIIGGGHGRHTLLRVTWKIYLTAILYAAIMLLVCWIVLIYVPDFTVHRYDNGTRQESPRTISNTLFFSQELAWCWIPSSYDLSPDVSFLKKMGLAFLQIAAAYASPVLFFFSATYAYIALRRCSPSLVRDHPIVLWRISVFCVYPTLVYLLGAVDRFALHPNVPQSSLLSLLLYSDNLVSKAHLVLSAVISFLYPFTAVVNVVLFLYTEELLSGIFVACRTKRQQWFRSCCCCCSCFSTCCCCGNINESDNSAADDHFDCCSDILQDRLTSEGCDDNNNNNNNNNNVMATTGFCGVVKVIACSTVTGLPPGAPPVHCPSTTILVGQVENNK